MKVKVTIKSVWITVEMPCPKCSKPIERAGRAEYRGGKLVNAKAIDGADERECNDCVKESNRETRRKRRSPKLKLSGA